MTKPKAWAVKWLFCKGDAVVRSTFLSFTFVLVSISSGPVSAQPPGRPATTTDAPSEFRFSDAAASASARRAQAEAAAQGRRQRAAFHAQQRALRMEANAWLGITPLRPTWPSLPYTHSYYQPRRIIYYPVVVDAN